MSRPDRQRGFTLLELLIALAIVGALLAIAFGGLRVAIAAWGQGEDRAEVHQELRGVAAVVRRAISATYPYRAPATNNPQPVILFRGEADRIELVTQAPPLPASVPIAFTAVVIGVETLDGNPALVVRQRPLPNTDPFTQAAVVLRDPAIDRIDFQYLNENGAWESRWETDAQAGLPRAVRVSFGLSRRQRPEALPPLTVALRPIVTLQ